MKQLDGEETKDYIILKTGEHRDIKDPENMKQFRFERSYNNIPRFIHGQRYW